MENASKALLIAASVLIAILVITIGIKIFSSSSKTDKVAMQTGNTISSKTGEVAESAISHIAGIGINGDGFNYGEGKTKATVAPGNEITITEGAVTERFTVISNKNGIILAMPRYNITLTENHPVQSSSAGKIEFSTGPYWSKDENNNIIPNWNSGAVNNAVDIEMNNVANNIQKYINAYKTTLKDMGAGRIDVRAAKKNELDGVSAKMINPEKSGIFWLGSSFTGYHTGVYGILNDGGTYHTNYYDTSGVRPIIIIY